MIAVFLRPVLRNSGRLETEWRAWSAKVGPHETASKEQFFHRDAQGRRSLIEAGCSAETVSDSVTLMGVKQRRAQGKEFKSISDSKEELRKRPCLPGSRARCAIVARVCAPGLGAGCFGDQTNKNEIYSSSYSRLFRY